MRRKKSSNERDPELNSKSVLKDGKVCTVLYENSCGKTRRFNQELCKTLGKKLRYEERVCRVVYIDYKGRLRMKKILATVDKVKGKLHTDLEVMEIEKVKARMKAIKKNMHAGVNSAVNKTAEPTRNSASDDDRNEDGIDDVEIVSYHGDEPVVLDSDEDSQACAQGQESQSDIDNETSESTIPIDPGPSTSKDVFSNRETNDSIELKKNDPLQLLLDVAESRLMNQRLGKSDENFFELFGPSPKPTDKIPSSQEQLKSKRKRMPVKMPQRCQRYYLRNIKSEPTQKSKKKLKIDSKRSEYSSNNVDVAVPGPSGIDSRSNRRSSIGTSEKASVVLSGPEINQDPYSSDGESFLGFDEDYNEVSFYQSTISRTNENLSGDEGNSSILSPHPGPSPKPSVNSNPPPHHHQEVVSTVPNTFQLLDHDYSLVSTIESYHVHSQNSHCSNVNEATVAPNSSPDKLCSPDKVVVCSEKKEQQILDYHDASCQTPLELAEPLLRLFMTDTDSPGSCHEIKVEPDLLECDISEAGADTNNLEYLAENTPNFFRSNSPPFFGFEFDEVGVKKKKEKRVNIPYESDGKCYVVIPQPDGNYNERRNPRGLELPFVCVFCKRGFKNKELMNAHMEVKHLNKSSKENPIPLFECDMCDYAGKSSDNLEKHTRLYHKRPKLFKCLSCDYQSSYSSHTRRHYLVVHEGVRGYACSYCNYAAGTSTILKGHIQRVHEKAEKKVKCPHCSFTCLTKGNLKPHVEAVHKKTRRYGCTKCDFRTCFKANLKAHFERIHLKLKEFQCSICSFRAFRRSHVKRHLTVVHGDRTGKKKHVRKIYLSNEKA